MPAVYALDVKPPTWRGHYRHMQKRDAAVWEKFLERHAAEFLGFAYDVALGGVVLQLDGVSDEERRGWQYTTALKIDAAGYQSDRVLIIEVRPEAQVSALGAAIAYTLVARRDRVFPLALAPAIVCEYVQPDVKWAAQQLGVLVLEVPA